MLNHQGLQDLINALELQDLIDTSLVFPSECDLKFNDYFYKESESYIEEIETVLNTTATTVTLTKKYLNLTELINSFKPKDNLYSDCVYTDIPCQSFYYAENKFDDKLYLFFEVVINDSPFTLLNICSKKGRENDCLLSIDLGMQYKGHSIHGDCNLFPLSEPFGLYTIKEIYLFN